MRIGVIGAGGMGREHIANLMAVGSSGDDSIDIVVVADVDVAAAASAAPDGAEISADPLATAGRDDLDALVVASPDDTHAELTIAAIEAGTPVLCEKPLASSLADARAVTEAEGRAGRPLVQVGFMRPYDSIHRDLAAELAELGPLVHLRSVHRNTNHEWQRPLDVVLSQSLIHDVHTARWLSGAEFDSVVTQVVRSERRIEHVHVLGTLVGGATVSMEFVEAAYGYDVEVEATTTDGWVAAAQPARSTVRRHGDERRHIGNDWFARFRSAYRAEIEGWLTGVRGGQVDGPTAADGLEAQRVVDAARRAAQSGERAAV